MLSCFKGETVSFQLTLLPHARHRIVKAIEMNNTTTIVLAATIAVLAIMAASAVYAQTVSTNPTPTQTGYSAQNPIGANGGTVFCFGCPRMSGTNGYGVGKGARGGMMGGYYP